jgi:hypothetical protein
MAPSRRDPRELQLPEQTIEGTEGTENCESKNKKLPVLFGVFLCALCVLCGLFKPFDHGNGSVPSGCPPLSLP